MDTHNIKEKERQTNRKKRTTKTELEHEKSTNNPPIAK